MKTLVGVIALAALLFVTPSFAQELPPGMPGAVPEHEFLKKFVGTWEVESEGSGMQGKAVMNSSMLGKLWIVNTSEHNMGGMEMKSIQMIGYDAEKKKYVGIWADSMVNFMWNYEGTLDESGKKLTLEAKGPSMTGDGTMMNYRDAYEFKDDDTIVATSSMQGGDGTWTVFMEGTAKRKKE